MIRFIFALSLSIVVAILLAFGVAYLDKLPDSSAIVSQRNIIAIQ